MHDLVADSGGNYLNQSTLTRTCLDGLVERGIDPAHYTTAAVVADIGALQHALDVEQWNLYGTSYSTTVMLLAMHA